MSRRQRVLEVAVAETAKSYARIVLEGATTTEDGARTLVVDLSGGGGASPAIYAPAYAASAPPAGYQWATGRLELAPCTSSFPALNLLSVDLPGTTRRNVAKWVAATVSGGTLAVQVGTTATDYNSVNHGSPTILDRTAPNAGRAMQLTMHVSGSITATDTNGVGIGLWDGTTHGRTARNAIYYVSGAIKIYHGYSTTETATTITAANLTTGVWLRLDIDTGGTLRIQYQIAATATSAPSSGWTTVYTVADYLWSWGGAPKWGHVVYSVHGYNSSAATRTMPAITFFDDVTMAGSAPRRSPLDGCGIGVSAASPEVTLFTDVSYSSSVATQAAIRAMAAAVAAQLPGETASAEFLVRSTNTPGSYTGSTWYAAGAIVAPAAAAYLEIKARIVSNGVQCGSMAVGAVPALRVA